MTIESSTEAAWRDGGRVDARRSFILMILGALVGLALAGYALFTARGTSTLLVPAEAVALVNQQPISRIDYLLQLKAVYDVDFDHSTVTQRKQVLDALIREELFVQRGKELDLASSDPDVRNALVNAVEMEIAQSALTSQPSETRLRSYFAEHRERYSSNGRMTVRDLVIPSAAGAGVADVLQALRRTPPSSALLAQLHVKDSGRTSGEEFYFAAEVHLGKELFDKARGLKDGEVSEPLPMDDGIHILYMEKNAQPVPFDFADAQVAVLSDFRKDAAAHSTAGDEAFLRQRANILIADDLR